MTTRPILYSFRRCPYAMRARMALVSSGQQVELREVVLRDKPAEMIAVSPKATVPVMVDVDSTVRDESLDIMLWALEQRDPDRWFVPSIGDKTEMLALVDRADGSFKKNLDTYKYSNRYAVEKDDAAALAREHRNAGMEFLMELDARLAAHDFLFGNRISLADVAIAPFIRQFANVDAAWFATQPCPNLQRWLRNFVNSELFLSVMQKYKQWKTNVPGIEFPDDQTA